MARKPLITALLALLGWVIFALFYNPIEVRWTQWLERPGDRVEFFYAHTAGAYSLDDSVMRTSAANRWLDYRVKVPSLKRVRSVRIDPSQLEQNLIGIGQVEIQTRWGSRHWQGEALLDALVGTHDYDVVRVEADQVWIRSRGNDPHFALAVERWLAYPPPLVLLAQALAVFLLTYGLAWLLTRLPGLRTAASLPARWVVQRPTTVMTVVAAAALLALASSWVRFTEVTPFFQGPDEAAHAANAFYGFNTYGMGQASTCGQVWSGINAVTDELGFMIRRFTLPMLPEHIDALAEIRQTHQWAATGNEMEASLAASCRNYKLINGIGYGAFSVPAFRLGYADDVIDWIRLTRYGQMVVGFSVVALLLALIIRGRSLFSLAVEHNVTALRYVVLLSTILYLAMPQNLYMFSVINREAYFVPAGLALTLSFLFWHRWLSPLLIALALYAFWPVRAVYFLIPMLWLLWLGVLLAYRQNPRWWLWGIPTGLVLAAYIAGPFVLLQLLAVREHLPFSMPGRLAIEQYFWHFNTQVARFTWRVVSLDVLNWRSFFGYLGSLDTPISLLVKSAYQWLFLALPVLFVACWWFAKPVNWRNIAKGWWVLLSFAVPLAITVSAITYAGYQVYVQHGIQAWGTQVQGRYFLPVYYYVFMVYFALAASPWIFGLGLGPGRLATAPAARAMGFAWLMLALMAAISVAFWLAATLSLEALEARYFVKRETFEAYRAVIR